MQNDGGYGGVPFFLRCPLSTIHYSLPTIPVISYSCALFALFRKRAKLKPFVFMGFRTLSQKHSGGGKEHTTYQGLRNSRDGLRQFANFLLELLAVAAAIGKRRAQPGMKFARPRLPRHLQDVGSIDSGSGDNDDPISRSSHQFGKNGRPLGSAPCASRCKNSVRAGLDHLSERLPQIRGFIEGAGKCHPQRLRKLKEFPRSLGVNSMVFRQNAKYHAFHARFLGAGAGTLHVSEPGSRIDEVSGAWADHHKNGQAHLRVHSADDLGARSNTAKRQTIAKFDAIRAAALRCQRSFESLHTDFENAFSDHIDSPAAERT